MIDKNKKKISKWILSKLDLIKDNPSILIMDPLRLLSDADGEIHSFALDNNFTVIVAATNLVFRELYEQTKSSKEILKLLIIDRAPAGRKHHFSSMKAPPPFYPDILDKTPEDARIEIDLRRFLIETTGDRNWPNQCNDPIFANLISNHLEAVLKAHRNLRAAHPKRFTDNDFKSIVAFSALGVPDVSFKKLSSKDYWRIGLINYELIRELEIIAPAITDAIINKLRKGPAPFCWFPDNDPDMVIRAFYLSVIMEQHTQLWGLLLAKIDPELGKFSSIDQKILTDSAPNLILQDKDKADEDLKRIENSLSKENLRFMLLDQLKINEITNAKDLIVKEHYSVLLRALALLLVLDDLLSVQPNHVVQEIISETLFSENQTKETVFIDQRQSIFWKNLKEAYRIAKDICPLIEELKKELKNIEAIKTENLTFNHFRNIWNIKRINRLEYFVSYLERLISSAYLLPKKKEELPDLFGDILERIRNNVKSLAVTINKLLDRFNSRFQDLIYTKYSSWVKQEKDVILTSQFLRRCLKPNWDPLNEKAVLFVFDGMRFDIWVELLRPLLEDQYEIIADYPASSLIPSETHISRKAIFSGTFPDEFDMRKSEDKLLREGMEREFNFKGEVEVLPPDGLGTGETVRYRAGNLDVIIFELCDKELHKIQVKTLPDNRKIPSRPLSFIYEQYIKNILNTELLSIVRGLDPGTKIFITADHGFNRVNREKIWLENTWLNHPKDCYYLNAWLRYSLNEIDAPPKVKSNVFEFPVETLRMPKTESVFDRSVNKTWEKEYKSIIFPKTEFSFCRQDSRFNPDAFSHGGISIQELMIPMVVLKEKPPEERLLVFKEIECKDEIVEGQNIEFRIYLQKETTKWAKEIKVEVEAFYYHNDDKFSLDPKIIYISRKETTIDFSFKPKTDIAVIEERNRGYINFVFTVNVNYKDDNKIATNSRARNFKVRLNPDQVVRRVPPQLGNILGLMPKK